MNDTQQVSQDSKNLAMLMWILSIFFGFLPGLIFFLTKKDDAFVYEHAKEALNFGITAMIASFISGILIVILVGLLMLMVVGIASLVFCIMGAMAASNGNPYRVPVSLRLIK